MAASLPLDAFLIDHFRILPTERSYRELTDDAKELLFLMVSAGPTSDEVRASMRRQEIREMKRPDDPAKKEAEKMGIDLSEIDKMIRSGELDAG